MADRLDALERLIEEVQASPKYRLISPELVRHVAEQEISKRRNHKEAVKAVRNKLHQVGGAYLEGRDESARWLEELSKGHPGGDEHALRHACLDIMRYHASTRERLPFLAEFYATLFSGLLPVQSLLDLACGLNPLARPWIPLTADCVYYACDIYQHMTYFLQQAFPLLGISGQAWVCDLTQQVPEQSVDVVLLLKTLPTLEQLDKQSSKRLLQQLNARYIVVSYPLRSLGGAGGKGMESFYESQLHLLLPETPWRIQQRHRFPNELAFVLANDADRD
jgi:16S rRNA (guanine(1405)-N(7))-methyltransferase